MGILDWLNQADALEVKHKGAPVLSHPKVVVKQEAEWEGERQEEEQGKQAHKAINDLFSSLDEVDES